MNFETTLLMWPIMHLTFISLSDNAHSLKYFSYLSNYNNLDKEPKIVVIILDNFTD